MHHQDNPKNKVDSSAPSSEIKKDDITTTDATVFMPLGGVTQNFGVKKTVVVKEKRRDEFFEQTPALFSLLKRRPASPLAEEGKYDSPEQRDHKGEYFITPETFALLLYRDFQKYNAKAGEDKQTVNTQRVLEIDNNPEKLCELLLSLKLKQGEDLKLIFIQDSHAVACYLRNDNGRMRCYIGDSIGNAPSTARNLARYFHACLDQPQVIIGPTIQSQFDFYSCYTFAKKMNMYFMKHGDDIFPHIERVGTTPDPVIPNCQTITAQNLMPALLKLCQQNLALSDTVLNTTVSQTKDQNLRDYYSEHKKELGLQDKDSNAFGPYNTAAITKRYKYFYELNTTLKQLDVHEIDSDPHAPLPKAIQDAIKDYYTPPLETDFAHVCAEIVAFMDSTASSMSPLARAYYNYISKKIPDFASWYQQCASQFAAESGDLQKLLLISFTANYFDQTKDKILTDVAANTTSLLTMHAGQQTAAIAHLRQENLLSPEALGTSIKKRLEAHQAAAAKNTQS